MFLYKELFEVGAFQFSKEGFAFSELQVPFDETKNRFHAKKFIDPYTVFAKHLSLAKRGNLFYLSDLFKIYKSTGQEKERESVTAAIFAIFWSEILNTDSHYFFLQPETFPDLVLNGISKDLIKQGNAHLLNQKTYFEIVTVRNFPIIYLNPESGIIEMIRRKTNKNYSFQEPLSLLVDVQVPTSYEMRQKLYKGLKNINWRSKFQDILIMSYSKAENDFIVSIERITSNYLTADMSKWDIPLLGTIKKIRKILLNLQKYEKKHNVVNRT